MSESKSDSPVPSASQTVGSATDLASSSRREFRELSELLPLTVFEVNMTGQFVWVNSHGRKLSGYSEQDLERGIAVLSVIRSADGVSVASNLAMKLTGGADSEDQYTLLCKDGSTRSVTIRSRALVADGRIVGLIGVAIDLSEQKRLEERHARAERLEAAGRVAGQVAHDFNNLLGPLLAYPQLVREHLPQHSRAHALLRDMEFAAQQIREINQQLLTLGRRGHCELTPVELSALVGACVGGFSLPPEIRLAVELGADAGWVLGGEAQLVRVLNNLVQNARDAMPEGGVVTLSTGLVDLPEQNGLMGRIPTGRYAHLTVSDTGSGISAALLERIFEPFYTTKRADRRRGSGLGLCTVAAVVQDHQGHLVVSSELGQGSTFHVYLPPTQPSPVTAPDQLLPSIGGGQALIVAEDGVGRQVTKGLLERLGFRVTLALSGEQARLLAERVIVPDLAVLEVATRDGMDGPTTLTELRKLHPSMPALLISGGLETDAVRSALGRGRTAFLRKPVTLEVLSRTLRALLG